MLLHLVGRQQLCLRASLLNEACLLDVGQVVIRGFSTIHHYQPASWREERAEGEKVGLTEALSDKAEYCECQCGLRHTVRLHL